jgi:Zn-dependent protease
MDEDLGGKAIYYLVFLFSTTLHEAAHAWVAMRGGDLTAYSGGQVSLDPRPHIRREPFGMVVLPILGLLTAGWPLGFASTPYDPYWARQHPKRAALMALGGPAANLSLALLAGVGLRITLGTMGSGEAGTLLDGTTRLLYDFFFLNTVLFVFNLIPLPPLDGSGAVPLFLSPRATERYQNFIFGNPMIGLVGMIAAWQIMDQLFPPVFGVLSTLVFGLRL